MIEMQTPRWDALDFPVSLRPLRAEVDGRLQDVPAHRCVYREDSEAIIDVVSSRYRLVPHGKVFRAMDEIARDVLPYGVRSVLTRTGAGGGFASVEWFFDHEVEVRKGDRVAVSLLVKNSVNRSASLSTELSARRLICSNGLRGPGPGFRRKWRHRSETLDVQRVISWLEGFPDLLLPAFERWQEWSGTMIFAERLREFLEEDGAVGQRARDEIMRHLETRSTARQAVVPLWDAYNALTWHATHRVRTRKRELQVLREEEVHRLALRFVEHATRN